MNRELAKKEYYTFAIYVLSFYILWSLYTVFLYQHVKTISPYLGVGMKLLIWTLPTYLIVSMRYKRILEYLRLINTNWKRVILYTAIIGAIIVIWNVFGNVFLYHNKFTINRGVSTWLGAVILIGFTEEVVFRGYILQVIIELIPFNKANFISSILFVIIHLPGWYQKGLFSFPTSLISSILYIFVFAFVQGYMLKKTNSLWACIFIHTINNFITVGFGV